MKTASDIMTRKVVTVSPDMPVRDVAELLAQKHFGSVPVVAADTRVLGMVTEEDMITRVADIHLPRHITFLGGILYLENPRQFTEEAEKILATTAADIMNPVFAWVPPDTPVNIIADRMLAEDIRRILVLDAHGHLVGIITRADIVRMLTSSEQLPDE
ncbi:MAG: CBS domain-containing protein [Armatimonadota bacterium]